MMDHEEAVETQASMRYVLGELTPEECESFEEHYADCSRCMSDVEVSSSFAANTKEVFRQRALTGETRKPFAWLRWRPFPALALSGALNVALVAGLGYGLVRGGAVSPAYIASSSQLESVDVVPVNSATRGSEGLAKVMVSRRPVVLTFDLRQHYDRYFYSIERAGTAVVSGEVNVPGHPESLSLPVPASRLSPGEYKLTVTATAGSVRDELGACVLQVQTR